MNLTVAEEREAESERGWHFAFLLFSLVVLSAIFLGCAFLYGKYTGREEARAKFDARPRTVISRSLALTQWTCTKEEFREHINTCAKRESQKAGT